MDDSQRKHKEIYHCHISLKGDTRDSLNIEEKKTCLMGTNTNIFSIVL